MMSVLADSCAANGPGCDWPGFPSWPVFAVLGMLLVLTFLVLIGKGSNSK